MTAINVNKLQVAISVLLIFFSSVAYSASTSDKKDPFGGFIDLFSSFFSNGEDADTILEKAQRLDMNQSQRYVESILGVPQYEKKGLVFPRTQVDFSSSME